ncbi:MAG: polyketide cyclase, partial [Minicystis sp.]
PEKITILLEFIKPFAATNVTTFTFTGSGGETKVVWAMDGENNFMGKAYSLFVDTEKMVGPDFEKGLAAMRAAAERPPAAPAAPAAMP